MSGLGSGRPESRRDWAVARLDSLLALALAVVFGVLGITGGASDDAVRAGTLAVLGLLGITLIRLRSAREETQRHVAGLTRSLGGVDSALDRLRGSLEDVRAEVAAIEGGSPWRVLNTELTWDMSSRQIAKFTKRRRLRFYRNDVLALYDWFSGDGTTRDETASPGTFVHEPKHVVGGREYSLIFLPHAFNRGNEGNFEVTRVVQDGFPGDRDEQVGIEILEETERATIKVIWPRDRQPTAVRLQGNKIGNELIDLADLAVESDGRRSFAYELVRPELGDEATIFWDW